MAISPDPIHPVGGVGTQDVLPGNLLAMLSMATWAAEFPVAEILLKTWDPLALICVRLMLSVVLLVPIWAMLDGPGVLLRANWLRGVRVGGLGFGLGMYLILVAQKLTDPVTVALIASTAPIAAAMLEVLHKTRRLTWAFVIGLTVSVAGGVVATSDLTLEEIGPGAALAVLSSVLFSWGSFKTVQGFPDLTPVGRTAITFTGGFVLVAGLCVLTHLAGHDLRPAAALDKTGWAMLRA